MHTNVHCGTVYNSQDMEATEMSIGHTMDDYSAMKKNQKDHSLDYMDLLQGNYPPIKNLKH